MIIEKGKYRFAHRRRFHVTGPRLAHKRQPVGGTRLVISATGFGKGRIESFGRGQRIKIANTDQLRARGDQTGDRAIASKVQQARNSEIDAMQIDIASGNQRGKISIGTKMGAGSDPLFDGGKPIAEGRAHGDAENRNPLANHIGSGGQIIKGRCLFAQHLPRKTSAVPQRRFRPRAFARFGACAEGRQFHHQHGIAPSREFRSQRRQQSLAAAKQFIGADIIGMAVRMNIEYRRNRRDACRAQIKSARLPAISGGEHQPFQRHILMTGTSLFDQCQRMSANLESVTQVLS